MGFFKNSFKNRIVRREIGWMGKNMRDDLKITSCIPLININDGEYYLDDVCIGYPVDDIEYPKSSEYATYYFIPRKYIIHMFGVNEAVDILLSHLSELWATKWEDVDLI